MVSKDFKIVVTVDTAALAEMVTNAIMTDGEIDEETMDKIMAECVTSKKCSK